jgi:hypothetical protein
MPGYGVRLTVASLATALALLSSPARAQLQTVGVGGLVLGPEDSPVAAERVVVLDRLGAVVASVASGSLVWDLLKYIRIPYPPGDEGVP